MNPPKGRERRLTTKRVQESGHLRARKRAENQNIDLLKPGEPGEDACEDVLERRTTKKSKL